MGRKGNREKFLSLSLPARALLSHCQLPLGLSCSLPFSQAVSHSALRNKEKPVEKAALARLGYAFFWYYLALTPIFHYNLKLYFEIGQDYKTKQVRDGLCLLNSYPGKECGKRAANDTVRRPYKVIKTKKYPNETYDRGRPGSTSQKSVKYYFICDHFFLYSYPVGTYSKQNAMLSTGLCCVLGHFTLTDT